MDSVVLYAYAKVNLTVDVLSRRPDGYHEVDLLMQSISLYDTLRLIREKGISLEVEGGAPADESNLVLRAARLLAKDAGMEPEARIHLIKRIPVAAGLGGGSADAAATLIGLNCLWGLQYSAERLLELGAKLGADVPFCIQGGLMRARGIGTMLEPVRNILPLYLVVLKPCEGLLTKEIFASLMLKENTVHPDTAAAAEAMTRGDREALIASMGNVLESAALPRRPQIREALDELLLQGALESRMSGSGSAVFGLFESKEKAEDAARRLAKKYEECYAVTGMDCGVWVCEKK